MDVALLQRTLAELGEPRYRAGQVLRWAFSGSDGFEQMTDLPSRLRSQLAEAVPFSTLSVQRESRARDGTVKVLLGTADRRPVEHEAQMAGQAKAAHVRDALPIEDEQIGLRL